MYACSEMKAKEKGSGLLLQQAVPQAGGRMAVGQQWLRWFSIEPLAHSVLSTSISVPDAPKEGQAGEHEGDSPSPGSRKTWLFTLSQKQMNKSWKRPTVTQFNSLRVLTLEAK